MISSATDDRDDDEGREETSTQESAGRVSAYVLLEDAVLTTEEIISGRARVLVGKVAGKAGEGQNEENLTYHRCEYYVVWVKCPSSRGANESQ
jgi:hypothetical protein